MAEAPELKVSGPYDKELGVFMALMRYKLEKNAHRGKWADAKMSNILAHLESEVRELREAVESGNVIDVSLEAADVANLAMIAAMIAMQKPNIDCPSVAKGICPLNWSKICWG